MQGSENSARGVWAYPCRCECAAGLEHVARSYQHRLSRSRVLTGGPRHALRPSQRSIGNHYLCAQKPNRKRIMLGMRRVRGVPARPHMLRLDGRLALARGLLRPSSELSGAGSRGADQLVGRKVERDAAEPKGSAAAAGFVSGDRAPSRPATARQDDEARRPLSGGGRAGEQNAAPPCASFCSNFTGTSMSYAV